MQSDNLKKRIFEDLTSKEFADYCKKNIYPALDEIKAKTNEVFVFSKKCKKIAITALVIFILSLIFFVVFCTVNISLKGVAALIFSIFSLLSPLLVFASLPVCIIAFVLSYIGQTTNDTIIKSSILEKVFAYWGSFKYIPKPTTKEEIQNPDNAFYVFASKFQAMSVFDRVDKIDFGMDDCFVGSYKDMDISIAEIGAIHRKNKDECIIVFSGCIVRMPSFKNFNNKTVIKSSLKGQNLFSGNLNEVKLEDTNFSKIFRVFAGDQIEARYLITTSFMKRLLELRQNMKNEISVLFENGEIFLLIHSNKNLFELPDKKNLTSFKNYQGPVIDFLNILYTIDAMKLDMNIGM